jgi:hypothetical protein
MSHRGTYLLSSNSVLHYYSLDYYILADVPASLKRRCELASSHLTKVASKGKIINLAYMIMCNHIF